MQCACAILPSAAYLALHYFSILSHKRHDVRKKVIEYEMCVLMFSTTLSETFLILRIQRDMIKNVHWSSFDITMWTSTTQADHVTCKMTMLKT